MIETARRVFQGLIALVSSLLLALTSLAPASAQGIFAQPRYSAIVVDAASGEVLYAKRADVQRFPASLTKIMTLYMAFEAMATGRLSPNDTIVMTPHGAAMQPSKLGLRAGEGVTLDTALQAIAVKSANDMAVAVAERIGGSEERFAQLMTLRAQELGMTGTHFANASGLPNPRNVSSARDLAILSRAVMRDYPQYYGYFGERSISFRGRVEQNHNHLLAKMPGVDGLKTGYIGASGFNLAASARRDGKRLIAVVLGGSSTATRDENVESLLNAGFEVMHRRGLGQRITLASLANPTDDSGPIQRPSVEEGDGDQAGVHVEVAESLRGPQGLPDNLATARSGGAIKRVVSDGLPDRDCSPRVSYVKKGRGRHAHRVRVVTNPCRGGAVAQTRIATATADSCAHKHGRAHKACERSARRRDVAEADAAPAKKSSSEGGYLIQVGAYKSKGDAKAQLHKVSSRFSSAVDGAGATVASSGGNYRARFTGFTSSEAKAACRQLSARGERCMVMSAS